MTAVKERDKGWSSETL